MCLLKRWKEFFLILRPLYYLSFLFAFVKIVIYIDGMSSFDDRKKSFEKKFANDQELQFKVTSRRNKYFGEWAASKLGKKDQDIEKYIDEVIMADLKEPGDIDLISKVLNDFQNLNIKISQEEIKIKLDDFFNLAKKDFY